MPGVLDSYNYSLLSIPAVWTVGIITHWHAIYLTKASKDIPPFDNRAPRAFLQKVTELAKTSRAAHQYLRAESAQLNIYENLGLWATAVLAGNFARLPISFLNKVAAAYVATRALYCVLYVKTEQQKYTPLRSIAFLASSILTLNLFVKASTNLNKALW
ncbi:hypothetical protein JCM10450v2_007492 [Rhodotorula kratochvilovae]